MKDGKLIFDGVHVTVSEKTERILVYNKRFIRRSRLTAHPPIWLHTPTVTHPPKLGRR